jgi:hypothetical protein
MLLSPSPLLSLFEVLDSCFFVLFFVCALSISDFRLAIAQPCARLADMVDRYGRCFLVSLSLLEGLVSLLVSLVVRSQKE